MSISFVASPPLLLLLWMESNSLIWTARRRARMLREDGNPEVAATADRLFLVATI